MSTTPPQAGWGSPAQTEGQGWGQPTRPPATRTPRWVWLAMAGGLAVLVLAGVVLAAVTSGGSSPSPSPAAAQAHGSAPQTLTKTFTHVPDGCALISAATIASYAPGATCEPAITDSHQLPGYILKQPHWKQGMGVWSNPVHGDFSVVVDVDSDGRMTKGNFDMYKHAALSMTQMVNFIDSRPLAGLGDEAYIIYGVDKMLGKAIGGGCDATIVTRWGNAAFSIDFHGSTHSDGGPDQPASQQVAEAALQAAAKDVYAALS